MCIAARNFNTDSSRNRKQLLLFTASAAVGTMEIQTDTCPAIAKAADLLAGDMDDTIYIQLTDAAKQYRDRVREFARLSAREAAMRFCPNGQDVLHRIQDDKKHSRATLIAADGGYKGLCGKHSAHIIAGCVRAHEVLVRRGANLMKKYCN